MLKAHPVLLRDMQVQSKTIHKYLLIRNPSKQNWGCNVTSVHLTKDSYFHAHQAHHDIRVWTPFLHMSKDSFFHDHRVLTFLLANSTKFGHAVAKKILSHSTKIKGSMDYQNLVK